MKSLEKILEQKEIDEQAKNLLQGILYKVEVSYKDYKRVKSKKKKEEKYIQEITENIEKRCNKISIVRLSEKVEDKKIQEELEKQKFYIGEEIISYPIEEKILYAIEKKSRHPKILNNKYGEAAIAISNLINCGKNMDRIEVLRDFNGWSWTTMKNEIENIGANLIYQTMQIILGEEFLDNWCEDKDGIIDYLELFQDEITQKYGEDMAQTQKELLEKIAISNTAKENKEFAKHISKQLKQLDKEIKKYDNTQEKIEEIIEHKKQLLKELSNIEKILGQKVRLKQEYEKVNEQAPIDKKIFNIKVLEKQLNSTKQQLLEQLEEANYLLNPSNYLKEKNKLQMQKERLELAHLTQKETEEMLIQFLRNFLKCFKLMCEDAKDEDDIVRLIYQFRYFMLLPFNLTKSVKDVETLKEDIMETEVVLVEKAIQEKVITKVPFEIMRHVFETRIIILEDLYYKITSNNGKYYVQIFDENVSEEKFEISPIEKMKINKKIKIFVWI